MGWFLLCVLITVFGIVQFGAGVAYGELRYKKKLAADDLAAKAKAKEKAEKAEAARKAEIETWTGDNARFISVPRAVQRANNAARDLLLMDAQLKQFARFCREDLEKELRQAELTWTMVWYSENNQWVQNPMVLKALREAIRDDGFTINYSEPEDGQGVGRIFIKVIGRGDPSKNEVSRTRTG